MIDSVEDPHCRIPIFVSRRSSTGRFSSSFTLDNPILIESESRNGALSFSRRDKKEWPLWPWEAFFLVFLGTGMGAREIDKERDGQPTFWSS